MRGWSSAFDHVFFVDVNLISSCSSLTVYLQVYSALQTHRAYSFTLYYLLSWYGMERWFSPRHAEYTCQGGIYASVLCFFDFLGDSPSTLRFFPLASFVFAGFSLAVVAVLLAGLSRAVSTLSTTTIDTSSDRVC